ncbi:hypothetical protein Tco_1061586, partial [Tanacetum coccineum]
PQSIGPIEHLADEVANEEHVPTQSNDPPLLRVNILRSGEDRLSLKELMDLCTKLSGSVLDLETTKIAQAKEIASLKKRVKKLEGKRKSKPPGMKRLFKIGRSAQVVSSEDEGLGDQEDVSKQGRKIADIDADAEVTLVYETQGRNDEEMFDIGILDGEEVFAERDMVEKEVITAGPVITAGEVVTTASATTTTVNELTLTQTLIEIKAAKPKVKGVMIQEPSETKTPVASKPSQDKGKAKMTEAGKPLRKKDQIMYNQEVALNLQAQLKAELEEERLAREQEKEANIALIESWDNTQAMMDTNRLFAKILRARKKSTMLTYLKHMSGYKQSQLKNKSFAEIQKLFDKAMTWVNMFVDMDTELVRESLKKDEAEMAQESSFKRAGGELEQEKAKKQKIDDDQEEAKLKELMEVISDEEGVAIDAIPLSTKPPSIVDYKIIKEGKISIY